jgi:hypothetical protein
MNDPSFDCDQCNWSMADPTSFWQNQTELYEVLNYHLFEDKLDQLYTENKKV